MNGFRSSRRTFIKGSGALVISFSMAGTWSSSALAQAASRPRLRFRSPRLVDQDQE